MLVVDHISKTFAKGTVNEHSAIRDLSITLKDGDFVTIVGSNGAGKSTLFNAICGSFLTDSGKILLDDMDITFKSEHERARVIGRVFQDPMKGTAPNMTIEENLAMAYTEIRQAFFDVFQSDHQREGKVFQGKSGEIQYGDRGSYENKDRSALRRSETGGHTSDVYTVGAEAPFTG